MEADFEFPDVLSDAEDNNASQIHRPASARVIEVSKLKSNAGKHIEITSLQEWMSFVFHKYQATNDVRICRIIIYVFHNTNVFLISEFSDSISPRCAAWAAGLVVNTGTIIRSSGSDVDLETTILSFE